MNFINVFFSNKKDYIIKLLHEYDFLVKKPGSCYWKLVPPRLSSLLVFNSSRCANKCLQWTFLSACLFFFLLYVWNQVEVIFFSLKVKKINHGCHCKEFYIHNSVFSLNNFQYIFLSCSSTIFIPTMILEDLIENY